MTNFKTARTHMVDSQVRTADVTNDALIRAMRHVPRERFVPQAQIARAYSDRVIELTPIAGADVNEVGSRWMLAPRDFSKLVQSADITPTDTVLDIGCGRGYSCAVISQLCDTVVGLEMSEADVDRATETLLDIGAENAAVLQADLAKGAPEHGPFDVIIAQGAVSEVPQAWIDQLNEGGRIAVIVMDGPIGRASVFTKSGGAVGQRIMFDASAPALPGFAAAPEFVF